MSLWVYESMSLWVYDSLSLWVHGSTGPRVHQSTSPRVHESTSPRVHESTSPRVYESKSPRVQESTSLWVHEVTSIKIGFLVQSYLYKRSVNETKINMWRTNYCREASVIRTLIKTCLFFEFICGKQDHATLCHAQRSFCGSNDNYDIITEN